MFLAPPGDHTADIYTTGRKMRVSVSPDVDIEPLMPGGEVMINEAMNVVDGSNSRGRRGRAAQGGARGGDRALVVGHGDKESVVRLAQRCATSSCAPATRC